MPDVVARVQITPSTGNLYLYGSSVDVSMSCATSGAVIYYTTDGSNPDAASTSSVLYTGTFSLLMNVPQILLTANAFKTGSTANLWSQVGFGAYGVEQSPVTGGLVVWLSANNTASINPVTASTTSAFYVQLLVVGGGGNSGGGVFNAAYDAGGGGGAVLTSTSYAVTKSFMEVVVGSSSQESIFGSFVAGGAEGGYVQGHGGRSGNGFAGGAQGVVYASAGGGGAAGTGSWLGGYTDNAPGGAGVTSSIRTGSPVVYGQGGPGDYGGSAVIPPLNSGQGGSYAKGAMGIVVVRYSGSQQATGGIVTTVGGDTVHSFLSSGFFTLGTGSATGVSTWNDLSGKGNNGMVLSGAMYLFNANPPYHYMKFNNTAKVEIPNSSSINMVTSWSLGAWIYADASGVGGGILERYNYVVGYGGYILRQNTDARPGTFILNGQAYTQLTGTAGTIPSGTWTHIVATYEQPTLKLYVNGAINASVSAATQPLSSTLPLSIGRYGDQTPTSDGFLGRMAVITVYDRALSASEVLTNYGASTGVFNPSYPTGSNIPYLSQSTYTGSVLVYEHRPVQVIAEISDYATGSGASRRVGRRTKMNQGMN